MQRYTKKNLEWVGRNRQPRWKDFTVGELAARVLEGRCLSVARRLSALQRAIAAHTDEEFGHHCTLGELRAGTLTILVDDPSCTAAMCARWLLPLNQLLKRPGAGPRVSSVRFAAGRSNLALDGSPDQAKGNKSDGPDKD